MSLGSIHTDGQLMITREFIQDNPARAFAMIEEFMQEEVYVQYFVDMDTGELVLKRIPRHERVVVLE